MQTVFAKQYGTVPITMTVRNRNGNRTGRNERIRSGCTALSQTHKHELLFIFSFHSCSIMKSSRFCRLYAQKRITFRMFNLLHGVILRRNARICLEEEDEWAEEPFDIERFSRKECKALFRFRKRDSETLCMALRIPRQMRTETRDVVSGI